MLSQSKLVIFLLTKSYFESKLFEKHLQESIELNKTILMIKLEEFDSISIKRFKIFDMIESIQDLSSFGYFSIIIEYKSDKRLDLSDKEVEFHEYMFDLKELLKVKTDSCNLNLFNLTIFKEIGSW
jgi:hypothetical protein